jgi:solute carrier family 25 (mitochondrial carnitine/acylcarnitine transporter), member 20/29|eukprot:Stramenopile-MAST_4_protein_3964
MTDQLKAFIAGGAGGAACVSVGFPFDTIKVKMQTAEAGVYKNMLDCVKQSVKSQGFLGLYQGLAAPLLAQPPMFAFYFWGYNIGTSLAKYIPGLHRADGSTDFYAPAILFAGGFSAIPGTLVMVPGERVKIAMQMDALSKPKKYTSSWDCTKKIVAEEGFGTLYKGTLATLARDMPGSVGWYGTYQLMKGMSQREDGTYSKFALLNAGGFAGISMWVIGVPPDVIKTRIQNSTPGQYPGGMKQVVQEIIAKDGLLGMYKGIGPALVRAYPANAACFFTVEIVTNFLTNQGY